MEGRGGSAAVLRPPPVSGGGPLPAARGGHQEPADGACSCCAGSGLYGAEPTPLRRGGGVAVRVGGDGGGDGVEGLRRDVGGGGVELPERLEVVEDHEFLDEGRILFGDGSRDDEGGVGMENGILVPKRLELVRKEDLIAEFDQDRRNIVRDALCCV